MRADALVLACVFACACGGQDKPRDIEVTVYFAGEVSAGATVWFQDPVTGELTDEGVTDELGVYWGAAANGATVSAAVPLVDSDAPSWYAYSLVGVEVGETVWLGDRRRRTTTTIGAISVQLPGAFPTGRDYEVSIGCKLTNALSLDAPVVMDVDESCVTADGMLVVRVLVYTLGEEEPIAFVPPQLVAAPTAGEVVSIDLPAYQTGLTSFDITMAGIPSGVAIARSELVVAYHGLRFDAERLDTEGVMSDTVVHAHRYVPGTGARLTWRAALGYGELDQIHGSQTKLASVGEPVPSDLVDFSTEMLPAVSFAEAVIGANEAPVLSWDDGGSAPVADGVIATALWTNPNQSFVRWVLFGPTDGTNSVAFPTIPDSLQLMKGVQGFPIETASIVIVDADHIADYEDFRLGSGQQVLDPSVPSGDLLLRLSSSGEATF